MSNEAIHRLERLTDEELFNLINVEFTDYRVEVLEAAKDELARRGFQLARTGADFEVITPTGIRLTAPKIVPTLESPNLVVPSSISTRWLGVYIYLRILRGIIPILIFIGVFIWGFSVGIP